MAYQKEHSLRLRQSQDYKKIEKKLGLKFNNKNLLTKALTHSSAVNLDRTKSNEVLEFLGDAVLELIVREHLVKKFPEKNEGKLNQMKKRFTQEQVLYKIGKELGIGELLIMDRGEELTGGKDRKSNISCGLEALIGAIYLDRGLDYTKRYIKKMLLQKRFKIARDCKSLINNWAMKQKKGIEYRVIEESGLPHQKIFLVGLYVNGNKVSQGKGKSKKQAEQEAARKFLNGLKKN
uniref:Ribonuclease 3 n=1 Tax=candidate division WOR-3 bacterium TaxID=2052148 RepID=A0A7V0Z756_UNCW3